MSKKIVNALKTKVKGLKYQDLKSPKKIENEDNISSGHLTYIDLIREQNLTINEQVITNKFINELCLKHESMILEGENGKNNYRPFLKQIFIKIFEHAGAAVPSDSIMEELITYYNRSGCKQFFSSQSQALRSFGLCMYSFHYLIPSYRERTYISCEDPNCLKFSFSVNDGIYNDNKILVCDLQNSVEFKLKCEGENVKYEEGKVSLTIPKELKNYKANDKNLFDVIIEYFQKFCEKFGFHFETKIEHILDNPLGVLSDINTSQDKNLNLKNLK